MMVDWSTELDRARSDSALHLCSGLLLAILSVIFIRRRRVERFRSACKSGDAVTVESILHTPNSLNVLWGITSQEISIGLMWACSDGHLKIMERLMCEERLFENRFSLASCFMCACKRNNIEAVKLLLKDHRVPIDVVNKDGYSPEQVTKVAEIKDLVRREHWSRIHAQIDEISQIVNLSVYNISEMRDCYENSTFLKAVDLKIRELDAKTRVLETQERLELQRLLGRFRRDQETILDKYNRETAGIKQSIEKDVCELKALL